MRTVGKLEGRMPKNFQSEGEMGLRPVARRIAS